MGEMVQWGMAFVVRERGDRIIETGDGRRISVEDRGREVYEKRRPMRWLVDGMIVTETVSLPGVGGEFLLVLFWKVAWWSGLMLGVTPQVRRMGTRSRFY